MTDKEYFNWFEENLSRLLMWFDAKHIFELTDPSVIGCEFQVFKEPIWNRPSGLLETIKDLKISLLKCAIFGRESK